MNTMTKLQKDVTKTSVTEFAIFKHFGISKYGILIIIWIGLSLVLSGVDWIKGSKRCLSIRDTIFLGAICGFIFHLPAFLSALIMNAIKKPILRFDFQGFYYTPQIWSQSRLYKWESIRAIKVKKDHSSKTGYKCTIFVSLFDGRCISLNEKIMPISYEQLMKLFRLRLPNIPIKVLK